MAACEKCWNDAYARMLADPSKSQTEHYYDLLKERKDHPCSSDQDRAAQVWKQILQLCLCPTFERENGEKIYLTSIHKLQTDIVVESIIEAIAAYGQEKFRAGVEKMRDAAIKDCWTDDSERAVIEEDDIRELARELFAELEEKG
jgi:hypothetical protein